jgi:hypothetical protein
MVRVAACLCSTMVIERISHVQISKTLLQVVESGEATKKG